MGWAVVEKILNTTRFLWLWTCETTPQRIQTTANLQPVRTWHTFLILIAPVSFPLADIAVHVARMARRLWELVGLMTLWTTETYDFVDYWDLWLWNTETYDFVDHWDSWLCGLLRLMTLWTTQTYDFVNYSDLWLCGLLRLMTLWTTETYDFVDYWDLWLCRLLRLMTLWTIETYDFVNP